MKVSVLRIEIVIKKMNAFMENALIDVQEFIAIQVFAKMVNVLDNAKMMEIVKIMKFVKIAFVLMFVVKYNAQEEALVKEEFAIRMFFFVLKINFIIKLKLSDAQSQDQIYKNAQSLFMLNNLNL